MHLRTPWVNWDLYLQRDRYLHEFTVILADAEPTIGEIGGGGLKGSVDKSFGRVIFRKRSKGKRKPKPPHPKPTKPCCCESNVEGCRKCRKCHRGGHGTYFHFPNVNILLIYTWIVYQFSSYKLTDIFSYLVGHSGCPGQSCQTACPGNYPIPYPGGPYTPPPPAPATTPPTTPSS